MAKHFFSLLAALWFIFDLQAQLPAAFNFQAVARDAQNQPIANKALTVRASILNTSGTAVYVETHNNIGTGTTGIFTFAIGKGTVSTGSRLDAVNWSAGGYSLKIEVDAGTGFKELQTSTLLAVPYALYANNAKEADSLKGGTVLRGSGTTGTISKFANPDSLVNSVITENNGNIGIGVAIPTKGILEVYKDTATSTANAIFGVGQGGISIQQNWPTIGFNQYRDASNSNKPKGMSNGFAWAQFVDKVSGNMHLTHLGTVSKDTEIPIANHANPLTIARTGIGVNKTSPAYSLDVEGRVKLSIGNEYIRFEPTLRVLSIVPLNVAPPGIYSSSSSNCTPLTFPGTVCPFVINTDGVNLSLQAPRVGIGTSYPSHILHVNGQARSTQSTWATASDIRVKQNVSQIDNALEVLKRFRPVKFNWTEIYRKEHPDTKQNNYGFIAQEVEKIIPEMVDQVKDYIDNELVENFRIMHTDALLPLLVKGIQEQQTTISAKQKEVTELKAQLAAVEERSAATHQKLTGIEQKLSALQLQVRALLEDKIAKKSKK